MNSSLPKYAGRRRVGERELREDLGVEVDVVADVAGRPPRRGHPERDLVREQMRERTVPCPRRPGGDRARRHVPVEEPVRLLCGRQCHDRAHREPPEQRPVGLPEQASEVRGQRPRVVNPLLDRPAVVGVRAAGEREPLREQHGIERGIRRRRRRAVVDLAGMVGLVAVAVREDDERAVPVGRHLDRVGRPAELAGQGRVGARSDGRHCGQHQRCGDDG